MRIKYLLLVGLLFLFSDCQKDDITLQEPVPIAEVTSNYISGDDAPDVVNYLDGFFNSSSLKLGKLNLPFDKKLVDKESIVKIKNKESGNTTFTFAVKRKKKDNHLFQVVVTKYSENDFSDPYIFKYVFDDSFRRDLNKGNENWRNYKNPLYPYSLSRINDEIVQGKNSPCPEIENDPSGSGGSSPGGTPAPTGGGATPTPSGDGGGGSTEDCSWWYDAVNDIIWINCGKYNMRVLQGDEIECP